MSRFTVTTPYISSWCAIDPNLTNKLFYLQTSPEYHMKRLLSADSGSIFQICRAFRIDEASQRHNPEFTLLEWYRLAFTHHDLMDEMDELLHLILQKNKATRYSYQAIFEKYCGFDPLTISFSELKIFAQQHINIEKFNGDHDDWLSLVFTHLIEPHLSGIVFVYDFPASQAALARLHPDDPRIASRFEVYVDGTELANGFYELNHAEEQRQRFMNDNQKRLELNLPQLELDEYFLAALEDGLPDCSGVALGIDRLVMLALGATSIDKVIAFPIAQA